MKFVFVLLLSPMLIQGIERNYDSHISDNKQINAQYSGSDHSKSTRGYVGHVEYSANIDSADGASRHVEYIGKGDGKINRVHHFEVHGNQGSSQSSDGSHSCTQQTPRPRFRYSRDQESRNVAQIEKDGKISGKYYYDEEHDSHGQQHYGSQHTNQNIAGSESKHYRDSKVRGGTFYEVHTDENQSGIHHSSGDDSKLSTEKDSSHRAQRRNVGKITARNHREIHVSQGQSKDQRLLNNQHISGSKQTRQVQSNRAEQNEKDGKIIGKYHYEIHGVKGQSGSGGESKRFSGSRQSIEHNGKNFKIHHEIRETKGQNVRGASHVNKGNQAAPGTKHSSDSHHSSNSRFDTGKKVASGTQSSGQRYHQNVHHSRDHSQSSSNGHGSGSGTQKTFILKTGTNQHSGARHSSNSDTSKVGAAYSSGARSSFTSGSRSAQGAGVKTNFASTYTVGTGHDCRSGASANY